MKIIEFTGWEGLGNPILPKLNACMHVSPDLYDERGDIDFEIRGLACHSLPTKLTEWLVDKTRQEFIEVYLETFKLPLSVCVLFAHGFQDKGTWTFWDGDSTHKVRDWVKSMDGKYGLLILSSCNEGQSLTTTKRSLILQPSAVIGHNDEFGDNAPFGSWNLYASDGREIDDYTLEYRLRQLRR